MTPEARSVLDFWFGALSSADWWKKDKALDERIRSTFEPLHQKACRCELWGWRASAEGRLAEIIVLDQFSRNIYRDQPGAFAQDPLALALAQEAVACGADAALPAEQRSFLYLPYMHSESAAIHEQAVQLFSAPGLEKNLEFEHAHKAIIDRFGRYPHRNAILGRPSSEEEKDFLQQPGSGF